MRLLYMSDHAEVSAPLEVALAREGLRAVQSWWWERAPEVVVIDVTEHPRAVERCRAVRASFPAVGVVAVEADGSPKARVELLRVGADDCLSRPFDVEELAVRCRLAASSPMLRSVPTSPSRSRLTRFWRSVAR